MVFNGACALYGAGMAQSSDKLIRSWPKFTLSWLKLVQSWLAPGRHQGGTKEAPRRHRGGTKEAPRRHQGGTKEEQEGEGEGEEEDTGEEEEEEVGLKKVLPPTRYSLTQAVTSGGNTFCQPRGGQGVGASSSWCREVACRGRNNTFVKF